MARFTPFRHLGLAAAIVGLALAVAPGSRAEEAEDARPTELPYDTPEEFPQLDPSYRMTSHKIVLILDHALNPRFVQLAPGDLVAWISYAKQPSLVVFERETAKKMVCHSLVNFKIQDDEIRSAPIHAGEFASFCQLKPGRYTYKVRRPDAGQIRASSAKQLDGTICVYPESGPAPAECPERKKKG